jgi:competence protein ComEA
MRNNSTLRNSWKDYFSFPKKLRKGIYALFIVIVLEIVYILYLHYFPSTAKPADVSQFQKEIDAFYAGRITDSAGNSKINADSATSEKNASELFLFNPNNLPEEDWRRLGLSDKQIHVIKNYESKGGRFRSKADVKKMYSITAEEYAMLEPYIQIPQQTPDTSHKRTYKKYERQLLIVDIGTADTLELLKLPAVGPSFARRISNFREKLGGFYSIDQLKEVWGLTDSMFQIIAPHIVLKDSTNLRKININTADYKTFNMHPYIDKAMASVIISYRNQHGTFHAIEELKKVSLVTGELYSKLAPYLKIE